MYEDVNDIDPLLLQDFCLDSQLCTCYRDFGEVLESDIVQCYDAHAAVHAQVEAEANATRASISARQVARDNYIQQEVAIQSQPAPAAYPVLGAHEMPSNSGTDPFPVSAINNQIRARGPSFFFSRGVTKSFG